MAGPCLDGWEYNPSTGKCCLNVDDVVTCVDPSDKGTWLAGGNTAVTETTLTVLRNRIWTGRSNYDLSGIDVANVVVEPIWAELSLSKPWPVRWQWYRNCPAYLDKNTGEWVTEGCTPIAGATGTFFAPDQFRANDSTYNPKDEEMPFRYPDIPLPPLTYQIGGMLDIPESKVVDGNDYKIYPPEQRYGTYLICTNKPKCWYRPTVSRDDPYFGINNYRCEWTVLSVDFPE